MTGYMIRPPSAAELQAAEARQVGALLETFRVDFMLVDPGHGPRPMRPWLALAGVFAAMSLPLAVLLVVGALAGSGIGSLLGALTTAAEGVALWIVLRRSWRSGPGRQVGTMVHRFDDGFVCAADRPRAFAWSDVPAVYAGRTRVHVNGQYMSTNYLYQLTTDDGHKIQFVGSEKEDPRELPNTDIEEFSGVLVEEVVERRRLPAAAAAVRAGRAVDFDGIAVGPDGLGLPTGLAPWSQVTEVRVHEGKLTVRVAGRRRFVRGAAAIPNFQAFMALVHLFAPKSIRT